MGAHQAPSAGIFAAGSFGIPQLHRTCGFSLQTKVVQGDAVQVRLMQQWMAGLRAVAATGDFVRRLLWWPSSSTLITPSLIQTKPSGGGPLKFVASQGGDQSDIDWLMCADETATLPGRHTLSEMNALSLLEDQYRDAISLWQVTGLTRPWNDPMADLLRAIDGESSTVLGCSVDGDLVATAMVGPDGHRGWVYYLAVAHHKQGHGLGRMMMKACEQWLIERGAVKLQLMIRTTNEPVISFYEGLGYELSDVQVRAKWLNTGQ